MKIYCTKDRALTEQVLTYRAYEAPNTGGEYVAQCGCGHFVKFANVDSIDELQELADRHEAVNKDAAVPLTQEQVDALTKIPPAAQEILAAANAPE